VLEFGCSTGYMSKALRDRLGATVVGVELNAEAAQQAQAHVERVLIGDAEELDLEAELGGERFDAILFADVLEHLRHPDRTLRAAAQLLKPGGVVVISMPNVAYWRVRVDLLRGRFDYRQTGILDRTHLRFFTEHTLGDLIRDAGLVQVRQQRVWGELQLRRSRLPNALRRGVEAWWRRRHPNLLTYQFVVTAKLAAAGVSN
jgi:2-polyprenyl-3-methyl-5-hydroxy-6-metoxy-1,4-benzoquinol methylase